ncbi:MAG: hypothetical protein GY774_04740 [Planctomycetes bacterium]|nr:hypothetical protein [Planctomycetota bacterium]
MEQKINQHAEKGRPGVTSTQHTAAKDVVAEKAAAAAMEEEASRRVDVRSAILAQASITSQINMLARCMMLISPKISADMSPADRAEFEEIKEAFASIKRMRSKP